MTENPRRHLFLLIALLFIFILSPFVLPYYYGPTILNIVGAVVLLSATYAVSARRLFLIIAAALSTFSIVMTFWLTAAPRHWVIVVAHASVVVLISFFAVAIRSSPAQRQGDFGQDLRSDLCLSSFRLRLGFCLLGDRGSAAWSVRLRLCRRR